MDLATCLKKMELVGVLAFATVDSDGAPQIRNISAIHYEPDAIYFFTARGKNFCKELLEDGRVQILYRRRNRRNGGILFSRNSRIWPTSIPVIQEVSASFSASTGRRWNILISV